MEMLELILVIFLFVIIVGLIILLNYGIKGHIEMTHEIERCREFKQKFAEVYHMPESLEREGLFEDLLEAKK